MLARRALHSGNGWLMCRFFCKSIGIRFSDKPLSSSDAIPFAQAKSSQPCPDRVRFLYNPVSAQHGSSLVDSSISRQSTGSSVRFSPSPDEHRNIQDALEDIGVRQRRYVV